MNITREEITQLAKDEVLVFESNEAGRHTFGYARLACEEFGANIGQGFGFSAQSFGIPTKDWDIERLPLPIIQFYIDRFVGFASRHLSNGWKFLVTKIGCDIKGYTPEEIAPLFKKAKELKNIYLPQEFWDILQNR